MSTHSFCFPSLPPSLSLLSLLTVADVQDALTLAEHREQRTLQRTRPRANLFDRTELTQTIQNINKHRHSERIVFIAALLSVGLGTALGVFSLWSFVVQDQVCHVALGAVASCARPRLYFQNGLFQPTSCAYASIVTLQCPPNVMATNFTTLPHAIHEYSQMIALEFIDVSNSPTLKNLPSGFGYIPNEKLNIKATNNSQLAVFPYSICASPHLKAIDLKNSNASVSIDWAHQIYDYRAQQQQSANAALQVPVGGGDGGTRSTEIIDSSNAGSGSASDGGKVIYINNACGTELYPTLKRLSIAANELQCTASDYNDRSVVHCSVLGFDQFVNLYHLNLNDNNFTSLGLPLASNLIHVLSNDGGEGVVTFIGNAITSITMKGYKREETVQWLSRVTATFDVKQVTRLDMNSANTKFSDLLLNGSPLLVNSMHNLIYLEIDTNQWGDLHHFLNKKTKLKHVGVGSMKLTNVNEEFNDLTSMLEHMELRANLLTYSGISHAFTHLHNAFQTGRSYLGLNFNRIEQLKHSLSGLKNLRELRIQGNLLTHIYADEIPKNVGHLQVADNQLVEINVAGLTQLRKLQVADNQLKRLSYAMWHACKQMEEIELSNNQIEWIDVDTFSQMVVLHRVDLSFNRLKSIDLRIFGQLKEREQQQEMWINLRGNLFTASVKSGIVNYLINVLECEHRVASGHAILSKGLFVVWL